MKQSLLTIMTLLFISTGFVPAKFAYKNNVTAPILSISGATTDTWTNNTGSDVYVRLTAKGGDGGIGYYSNSVGSVVSNNGGQGATISGVFLIQNGVTLRAISGSKGANGSGSRPTLGGGGGGGGSGVVNQTTGDILIIAGGGGGGGYTIAVGSGASILEGSGNGGGGVSFIGSGGGGLNSAGADAEFGASIGGAKVSKTGPAAGGTTGLSGHGNGGAGMGGGGAAGGGGGGQTGGTGNTTPAGSLPGGACQTNVAGQNTNSPQDGSVTIEILSNVTYYRDYDGDTYGDPNTTITDLQTCVPAGYVTDDTDCDDDNDKIHPATKWYLDGDNDNYYDELSPDFYTGCKSPGGNYKRGDLVQSGDCDDKNTSVNPQTNWILDVDLDGYYPGDPVVQCSSPGKDYIIKDNQLPGDCDDDNRSINPKTAWIRDADQDGYYPGDPVAGCITPGTGYIILTNQIARDCDDNDPIVNPGSVEVCGNKKDDNCNGQVDEQGCYTCGNATSLSTTNITSSGATFNWVSIPHPAEWQLQYKSTATGSKWVDAFVSGNKRSHTVTSLAPNQNYLWHIRAKCGKNFTTYSVSVPFTTQSLNNDLTRSNVFGINAAKEKTPELRISATPNPSYTNFRIALAGDDLNVPVRLIVTDLMGRVIETRITTPGKVLTLGDKYRSGTYVVRIIQGKETRQVKLVKLPD